ncbi:unnamed protein product [Oncorhynchus mykiss]|uniref:Uncharacterized protein n=1 Tax=Oncorhynchus mykiss TaxID=8022 RepID=A0A060W4F4_ONCMY|nr:unnamed protein product [Oncorhynchus mykiss]
MFKNILIYILFEGTSLADQVRRIKDIEAIESKSFVPQAFKSSRDSVKCSEAPRGQTPAALSNITDISSLPTTIRYNDSDTLAHPRVSSPLSHTHTFPIGGHKHTHTHRNMKYRIDCLRVLGPLITHTCPLRLFDSHTHTHPTHDNQEFPSTQSQALG